MIETYDLNDLIYETKVQILRDVILEIAKDNDLLAVDILSCLKNHGNTFNRTSLDTSIYYYLRGSLDDPGPRGGFLRMNYKRLCEYAKEKIKPAEEELSSFEIKIQALSTIAELMDLCGTHLTTFKNYKYNESERRNINSLILKGFKIIRQALNQEGSDHSIINKYIIRINSNLRVMYEYGFITLEQIMKNKRVLIPYHSSYQVKQFDLEYFICKNITQDFNRKFLKHYY